MEENNPNKIEEKKTSEGIVKKYLPFVWEIVKIAVVAFVIVAPIRYFLFQPFIVSGASMAPNFETGDYLIVDEISYRISVPQREDVVVFDASFIPNYAGQRFIKRVIGLPGETVDVVNGKVEIIKDGKTVVLSEKYLPSGLQTFGFDGSAMSLSPEKITLAPDQYFVMGDNRNESYDSRRWGVLSRKYIIGKAAFRIFPLTSISKF